MILVEGLLDLPIAYLILAPAMAAFDISLEESSKVIISSETMFSFFGNYSLAIQFTSGRLSPTANRFKYKKNIMENQYYSKKLDQFFPTRVDILLYAHDGRGLGHASRTIAIGMALKRLYPHLRILFVTGVKISQSLIGNATLDWIKLPSYASQVKDGISTGVDGPANFYKSVLGQHRQDMLAQIVESFKPRCVLVDHSPVGKRKELLKAIATSKQFKTKWVLGLRAVIGSQNDYWSDYLGEMYREHYHSIFWYGDKTILGNEQLHKVNDHFLCEATEMGYVSRLFEAEKLKGKGSKEYTGTISVPWLSSDSYHFISELKKALQNRDNNEIWKIFIDHNEVDNTTKLFKDVHNCTVEPVGERYTSTLLSSKIAIVYGGYNSLMDIFAAKLPAIVVMRDMKDQEQEIHIKKILEHLPEKIIQSEEATANKTAINDAIDLLLSKSYSENTININGSTNTAKKLHELISLTSTT